MSHAGSWRAACNTTNHFLPFRIESAFGSTRRDRSQRWLWRLVGRLSFGSRERIHCTICRGSRSLPHTHGVRYGKLSFSINANTSAQGLPRTLAREAGPFPSTTDAALDKPETRKRAFVSRFDRLRPLQILPNVKDEPRRELARRVQHYDSLSVVSFRTSFGRTRRDRSRRWLWRLVSRFSG